MASIFDVAEYILARQGAMTAMKLQKLVYYCQAWSLVWDDRPLFDGKIEAWSNGPVAPELYQAHRGLFEVQPGRFSGNPDALSPAERETIDAVLKDYGDKTSQWLGDLTHEEAPWREARGALPVSERGNSEITHAAMAEYYGGLLSRG